MFSRNGPARALLAFVCIAIGLGVRSTAARETARAASGPPVGSGAWRSVFADEFDGSTLKTALWSTCDFVIIGNGCRGGSPTELGWHVPDEVLVENGILRLRAQQRTVFDSQGGRHDFTTGFVTTRERFNFKYGFFETRVKLPRGRAMWPAFFTTPVRRRDHIPEIDVFEMLGTDPTKVYLTYHFPDVAPPNHQTQLEYVDPSGFDTNFHTFGVLWEPNLLVYYVDGVERWRVTDRVTDEHLQLALRFGLGINWNGNGYVDGTSIFPSYFDIDYVRVWQRGNPVGGAVIDEAGDFDKVFAFSQQPAQYSGNESQFEGDNTRWAPPNSEPMFVVWDVNSARTFEATTFFWPGTNVRDYRFYASTDLVNYNEVTPAKTQSAAGWNKVVYRLNLPANTRLVRVNFPQMDQGWHTTFNRAVFSPDASIPTPTLPPTSTPAPLGTNPPTNTPGPQSTGTPAPQATNTPQPQPQPTNTSTPVPQGGSASLTIRSQNSSGTVLANLRTTVLNLSTSALVTNNTDGQGNVFLSVPAGSYKICQDIPANHRPLFGAIDADGRACVWFSLVAGNQLNLLFAYEPTGTAPTPTPIPTVTPATGGNARVTYRVVAAPKSIQNFRFSDNLTGGLTDIELDDAIPNDGDAFGNERSTAVNPGTYTIAATVPTGWYVADIDCGTASGAQIDRAAARVDLSVAAGANITCNFMMSRYGEISGNVWSDTNRDGRPVSTEPGLNDWIVGVYCGSNATTCTSARAARTQNGNASFTLTKRDNYLICVTPKAGFAGTYPQSPTISNGLICYAITLLEGTIVELWYGFAPGAVGAASEAGNGPDRNLNTGYPVPVIYRMPDVPSNNAGYAYVDSPKRVWLPVIASR
jgi:beta-glucanase (GH16 family)